MEREGFEQPILIGQSLGGFLSQVYMDLYPGEVSGFIAIDSAPMKRAYYQAWEIFFLHHTHAMYASIPWKLLLPWGSAGCSTTAHGRALMRQMMECYEKPDYVDLAAHGYEAVANAVDANRSYDLDCPALVICGTKDMAGSSRRYSKTWAAREGLPIEWIAGAGHNSNVDAPREVNELIQAFVETVASNTHKKADARRISGAHGSI